MQSSLEFLVQTRKEKLLTYLNNNCDELSLEKQHQLYGAINELGIISGILNNDQENAIKPELQKPKAPMAATLAFFKDLF